MARKFTEIYESMGGSKRLFVVTFKNKAYPDEDGNVPEERIGIKADTAGEAEETLLNDIHSPGQVEIISVVPSGERIQDVESDRPGYPDPDDPTGLENDAYSRMG